FTENVKKNSYELCAGFKYPAPPSAKDSVRSRHPFSQKHRVVCDVSPDFEQQDTRCHALRHASKTFVEFSKQTCSLPKISIADDIDNSLRAGDSYVKQIGASARPITSAGLRRVSGAQHKDYRLSRAPLHRMHCADSLLDPALFVVNPTF